MTARNETAANLPALVPGETAHATPRAPYACEDARFAAQLMGASGARRGLRGGPPVLQAAQAAYLSTQWSGVHERRLVAGAAATSQV